MTFSSKNKSKDDDNLYLLFELAIIFTFPLLQSVCDFFMILKSHAIRVAHP